jgi:hypothetical protein
VSLRPLACLGLLVAGCGGDDTSRAEAEQAIRACFAGYKAAVLEGNGDAALGCVDAATIAYYEKLLGFALRASAEETRKLPLMDRVTVVLLRARIEAGLLRTMDGRKLFVHAVELGMIGKDSVIRNELGEIVVSGGHATGEHVSAGKPSAMHWRFHHENGAWRMDLLSILPKATLAFQQVIRESGMTEDEFILQMVAMLTGREPTDDVWQPVSR